MSESIALRNRVEHSHERIDALEVKLLKFFDGSGTLAEALAKIEKLEGEIRMIKARMGKKDFVG